MKIQWPEVNTEQPKKANSCTFSEISHYVYNLQLHLEITESL